mgnify:CR=1 FL=1
MPLPVNYKSFLFSIPSPISSFCGRYIPSLSNFIKSFYSFYRYVYDDDGLYTKEFIDDICMLKCYDNPNIEEMIEENESTENVVSSLGIPSMDYDNFKNWSTIGSVDLIGKGNNCRLLDLIPGNNLYLQLRHNEENGGIKSKFKVKWLEYKVSYIRFNVAGNQRQDRGKDILKVVINWSDNLNQEYLYNVDWNSDFQEHTIDIYPPSESTSGTIEFYIVKPEDAGEDWDNEYGIFLDDIRIYDISDELLFYDLFDYENVNGNCGQGGGDEGGGDDEGDGYGGDGYGGDGYGGDGCPYDPFYGYYANHYYYYDSDGDGCIDTSKPHYTENDAQLNDIKVAISHCVGNVLNLQDKSLYILDITAPVGTYFDLVANGWPVATAKIFKERNIYKFEMIYNSQSTLDCCYKYPNTTIQIVFYRSWKENFDTHREIFKTIDNIKIRQPDFKYYKIDAIYKNYIPSNVIVEVHNTVDKNIQINGFSDDYYYYLIRYSFNDPDLGIKTDWIREFKINPGDFDFVFEDEDPPLKKYVNNVGVSFNNIWYYEFKIIHNYCSNTGLTLKTKELGGRIPRNSFYDYINPVISTDVGFSLGGRIVTLTNAEPFKTLNFNLKLVPFTALGCQAENGTNKINNISFYELLNKLAVAIINPKTGVTEKYVYPYTIMIVKTFNKTNDQSTMLTLNEYSKVEFIKLEQIYNAGGEYNYTIKVDKSVSDMCLQTFIIPIYKEQQQEIEETIAGNSGGYTGTVYFPENIQVVNAMVIQIKYAPN